MRDLNIKDNNIISGLEKDEDTAIDLSLRPKDFSEYIGQETIKRNLQISINAAKSRHETLEHILLYGAPGLGKTTLAHIIAEEMGVNIKVTSGPVLEKAGDLAAILTNLEDGDILFIDEIHRLNKIVEEILYPAMEDYALDIIIGKGPSAKTIRIDLPKITIIGATTRISLISAPLRDRFGNIFRLVFYNDKEIKQIIKRSADILNIEINDDAAEEIAKRSRRTPRVANRLLKRVRDYINVQGRNIITLNDAKDMLKSLEIDPMGLDQVDREILETILYKFSGGPVGLNTLSAATNEEMSAIEDVYEPFLIQIGFIARTPRGRVITELGKKHIISYK
ncbi:MAG TPA: Holliday junction branch migration DNA helicase RuvB [bacterium]|nr:Holliday junction branch migration DNA helicase RuvB [bacterium]HQL11399.1 Holliday junction branch migration DNA helicase RuvB [bacterium]